MIVIELPAVIAEYFGADRARDAAAVAGCFTVDAVVRDDGHTHTGRDAIREWTADYIAKYNCTAEPFAIAKKGGRTVVTSHVSGDFAGSPIDLCYLFTLAGDAISGLEIKP
jgi:uncharacterized protein (TIGR02246 family)